MTLRIEKADARSLPLVDGSVQCVVTSPPYWGLRKYAGEQESVWGGNPTAKASTATPTSTTGTCVRCGAWRGAFGLEPTIEMYVAHTLEILREIRRVLRPDGVCFWNLGDSYSSHPNQRAPGDGDTAGYKQATNVGSRTVGSRAADGLKPKDLCLMPSRIALAAQADGWWVRSMIVWAKPNPMPESVTDRPTDAYEYILMLTKSERYFWDADAVREPSTGNTHSRGTGTGGPKALERGSYEGWTDGTREVLASRNLRNVWTFATQPYSGAHFATFPEELPRRCILAATSAKGACAQCGAPWEHVVRATGGMIGQSYVLHTDDDERGKMPSIERREKMLDGTYRRDLIGWRPTCLCRGQRGATVPCVVLDPFGGSGTTGRVAVELNRHGILFDIAYDAEYRELAEKRTSKVQRNLI